MTVTTEPEFYDRAMTGKGEPAMLSLKRSTWGPMYREAARWVPANHRVVDLGCGTGRFLHALEEQKHYGHRIGLDFSAAAIAEARGYLDIVKVEADLEVVDLREWQPDPERPGSTTYVCLEVLEHLEDDLGLISRVPPGHQFVFSVPNYESKSHLRLFRSAGDVWGRYGSLLEMRRWSIVKLDDRKAIHVLDSVRRTDSW